MNKRNIFFGVIIIAALAGWYIYKEYNRRNPDLYNVEAFAKLNAADILKAFETNEQKTNSIYLGKVVLINGPVKDIHVDEKGDYTIALGDRHSMSSVRCSMDSLHTKQIVSLKVGDVINIKGACTGYNPDELLGSDVILNRCVIENKRR